MTACFILGTDTLPIEIKRKRYAKNVSTCQRLVPFNGVNLKSTPINSGPLAGSYPNLVPRASPAFKMAVHFENRGGPGNEVGSYLRANNMFFSVISKFNFSFLYTFSF